jgi:hypothetical protein
MSWMIRLNDVRCGMTMTGCIVGAIICTHSCKWASGEVERRTESTRTSSSSWISRWSHSIC